MNMALRRFGLTLALVVLGALALTPAAQAQSSCVPGAPPLIIYHAGSLTAAFTAVEKLFVQQTGACITDVAAGSVDLVRRVTAGGEPCDILASADFEDIELLLEPARAADYDIRFAQGAMVLAYTTASKGAATIAAAGAFNPPAAVPDAAPDWYHQLTASGVAIGGSHPFLDPSGYRADLIFQLTEDHYGIANLYDTLLTHYFITRTTDALGKTYDYQLIYEHSAFAAFTADATKSYRYVRLPDAVSLGNPALNRRYRDATIVMPGLGVGRDDDRKVAIPASRVVWGLTILKAAPHPDTAVKFLQLLFGAQGVALQTAAGPAPISPPQVDRDDAAHLPRALRPLVTIARDDGR
jgi:molybdate/tungstate transport system substrate-binding protein